MNSIKKSFQSLVKPKREPMQKNHSDDEFKQVPEEVKKRVPDSAHLQRIRAMLVAAHTNDTFIKELAHGNSY